MDFLVKICIFNYLFKLFQNCNSVKIHFNRVIKNRQRQYSQTKSRIKEVEKITQNTIKILLSLGIILYIYILIQKEALISERLS